MRKDYCRDVWTYVAPSRGERTNQFRVADENDEVVAPPGVQDVAVSGSCDFCPGNEDRTPPVVDVLHDASVWSVRVFPNKYPIVGREEPVSPPLVVESSHGAHEVVVETPDHGRQFVDLTVEQVSRVILMYGRRVAALSSDPAIQWVQVFKNHGPAGGASLFHSHSQIIATGRLPEPIRGKMDRSQAGGCMYCSVVVMEEAGPRAVLANEDFVAFVPFAPQHDFEVWIVSREHVSQLEALSEGQRTSLADMLLQVANRILLLTNSYNFLVFCGQKDRELHLHVEVVPRFPDRLKAGFELSTGYSVVTVTPEDMAAQLRVGLSRPGLR